MRMRHEARATTRAAEACSHIEDKRWRNVQIERSLIDRTSAVEIREIRIEVMTLILSFCEARVNQRKCNQNQSTNHKTADIEVAKVMNLCIWATHFYPFTLL